MLESVIIENINRLEESLMGKNTKVMKNKKHGIIRLNLEDYSEVEI